MAIIKSREVFLHPSGITEALESDLAATAPTIRAYGIVSRSLKPRSLGSSFICIDSKEAKRIEKSLASAKRSKNEIKNLRNLSGQAEDSRLKIESERRSLELKISRLEDHIRSLERNLETLSKNINDKELLIQSAKAGASKSTSGLAKLIDRGANGLPLQGGLPSLGKNSR